MNKKETQIASKKIFTGKIIKVFEDDVICPNMHHAKREIVRHNGGAAILCINDKNQILLIEQYRYAFDEVLYELPAGKLEQAEDPYLTALRELEEETGFKASKLDYLGTIFPTVGYSDEKIYLYLANSFTKTTTHFDEDEVIEYKFYDLKVVLKMINNGEIKDAKTICAIHYYLNKMAS